MADALKPIITKEYPTLDRCVTYRLRVPAEWIMDTRSPRLQLTWWMLKLCWSDWRKERRDG
jgi:hypothetical protein